MAENAAGFSDLNQDKYDKDELKIICLGDSAVGKSKEVDTLAALRLRICAGIPKVACSNLHHCQMTSYSAGPLNFWDTAGQEKFQSMHPSYYHKAHACIMLFRDAIKLALSYKLNSCDFMDEVMRELENFDMDKKDDYSDKEDDSLKEDNIKKT
ncbi:RBL2A protein, partial [Polypterus senegalus]